MLAVPTQSQQIENCLVFWLHCRDTPSMPPSPHWAPATALLQQLPFFLRRSQGSHHDPAPATWALALPPAKAKTTIKQGRSKACSGLQLQALGPWPCSWPSSNNHHTWEKYWLALSSSCSPYGSSSIPHDGSDCHHTPGENAAHTRLEPSPPTKPLSTCRLHRDTPIQEHIFKTGIGNCFT